MSSRARAMPWFREPGERYDRAIQQIDERERVKNADPVQTNWSLPPMIFFFDTRGQPHVVSAAGGYVQ